MRPPGVPTPVMQPPTPPNLPNPTGPPPVPMPGGMPPGMPGAPPPGVPGMPPMGPRPVAPPQGVPVPGAGPPQIGPPGAVPAGTGKSTPNLAEALRQAGIKLPPDDALKERDLGRRSPRGSDDHIYEIVAKDLAHWLDRMPHVLATALKGGPHQQAPFKVPATGQQKYEVFKAKLFNDDGSVNVEGRQELLQRMTPKQYAQVVHVVAKHMKREHGEMVEEDE
jgi:hypothetical protein